MTDTRTIDWQRTGGRMSRVTVTTQEPVSQEVLYAYLAANVQTAFGYNNAFAAWQRNVQAQTEAIKALRSQYAGCGLFGGLLGGIL